MSSPQPVLLITGGSRGIGAATALRAAEEGWAIALNYRTDAAAATRVVEAIALAGGEAIALAADVAVDAEVVHMFSALDAHFGTGRLRGLVNNAGIVGHPQRVDEMAAERVQRMFAVNVLGSMYCAREAVRRMSPKFGGPGGHIVNVGSVAARLGSPAQYVDYAASKAAIDTFTLGLARELAAEGLRVNAVRPGIIDTEIHASGGEPDRVERLRTVIPMQRAGTADEVARVILWLLSDAASYTTGAIVDVSGGR